MSKFSGAKHKGAMKEYRATKRADAEARNAKANASRYTCGHVHGAGMACAQHDLERVAPA